MKILVIGSEGYIGSRLVPYLSGNGYIVDWIDAVFYSDLIYKIDYNTLSKEDYSKYEVIILLAGHSSPSLCENDIEGSFQNNVVNFANLLGKLNKNQRLLYASSASVCNRMNLPTEDEQLKAPISHYDMQKQMIEKRALISEATTIGMRFGVVAGYSPNPRLDSIINSVYHDAYNKGVITLNNGNNIRSYLGMNDLCKAVEALITLPNPEKIYNIASGTRSINDIGYQIAEITKVKINHAEPDNDYSFGMNCDRINQVVKMTDTIESIIADMGNMATKDKSIYNRNTNLFKY